MKFTTAAMIVTSQRSRPFARRNATVRTPFDGQNIEMRRDPCGRRYASEDARVVKVNATNRPAVQSRGPLGWALAAGLRHAASPSTQSSFVLFMMTVVP